MLMNRRAMLTYSVASLALALTGCKTSTTKVVVYNKTGATLSIDASASASGKTYRFNKKNIPNGKSAQQSYVTQLKKGSYVNFTVNSVTIGGKPQPGVAPVLPILVGSTNVFTVHADGTVTPGNN